VRQAGRWGNHPAVADRVLRASDAVTGVVFQQHDVHGRKLSGRFWNHPQPEGDAGCW
jgi:hypothetical protein